MFKKLKGLYGRYRERRMESYRKRVVQEANDAINISLLEDGLVYLTYKGEPIIPLTLITIPESSEIAKVLAIRDAYIRRRTNG